MPTAASPRWIRTRVPEVRGVPPGAASDRASVPAGSAVDATDPLAPGPLLRIGDDRLQVDIAPVAGGRIAAIRYDDVPLLLGHGESDGTAIGWGCFPMVPWAGRIRDGRFRLEGREIGLRRTFGRHAIHGVGFLMPWRVIAHGARRIDLSLSLPEDARWPFGGSARQSILVDDEGVLEMTLSVTAGAQPMPVTLGWHPWFRKPARLDFRPYAMYPRDADGIAVRPTGAPGGGPFDDCFLNDAPVDLEIDGIALQMTSDCGHWVLYDMPPDATCVEPQTGPPDAPTLAPEVLARGQTRSAWCRLAWR